MPTLPTAVSRTACSSGVSQLDRGRSGDRAYCWKIGVRAAWSSGLVTSNQTSEALSKAASTLSEPQAVPGFSIWTVP